MRYRILAVDDDPDVLLFVRTALSSQYEVITATNGPEALDKFREGEPDLVLLDVMMPGMSGYDVCQEIRKIPGKKNLPIIMLSALDGVDDHKAGYREGATFYLTKPIPPDRLVRNVEVQLAAIPSPAPKKLSFDKLQESNHVKPTRPAAADKSKSAVPASKTVPENEGAPRPRIIVVDDDPDILRILQILFERDYEYIAAMDGVEAIRKVTSYEPDLIIVDIMIPKVNGFQVCTTIRKMERFVHIPIVFLTGRDEPKLREMSISFNAFFVLKPANYKELALNVKRLMEKSPTLSIPRKVVYEQIPDEDKGLIENLGDREKVRWMD